MSAIKIRTKGAATQAPLGAPKKESRSIFPILILLVLVGAGGYFGWQQLEKRKADQLEKERIYQQKLAEQKKREAEEDLRYKAREEQRKKERAEKEAKRKAEMEAARKRRERMMNPYEDTEEEEEKFAKKSLQDILREDVEKRKAALAEMDNFRKQPSGKNIEEISGVKLGVPLKEAKSVYWGPILDGGSSAAESGLTFAILGPKPTKPFESFTTPPTVWVTPKTHRPYRVDFKRPLAKGALHDPDTKKITASIRKEYEGKPFILMPSRGKRPGCEFAALMGQTFLHVGEYDDGLRVSVIREDLQKEAKAESDALLAEKKEAASGAEMESVLASKKYPQGVPEKGALGQIKMAEGTPKAFCGLQFGYPAKPLTPMITPHEGAKGFYLDYERAKCKPFMEFTHGKADVDPYRGGVYAVHLFCAGGAAGMDDKTYFKAVRDALTAHFKAEPREEAGEIFPKLIYTVGDVEVTFSAHAQGGFDLSANNRILAELAQKAPPAPKKKRRR